MPPDPARERLSRERVLTAAVAFADTHGLDAVSMRRLAADLDVVPMALYKHVSDKEALLDGMADLALAELGPLVDQDDWRATVRARILAARELLLRHRWLRRVLETRPRQTPTMLAYLDSLIAVFRRSGFSDALTHHVMHALGSRAWGFTQELFDDPNPAPPPSPEQLIQLSQAFPHVAAMAGVAGHVDESVVGRGCDDQFEFEFALDLILDGIAERQSAGWEPPVR
ncbi:MAG: TetR/AcrR family transcriptional regulator [Propionibacteriales bacterium]|nr:TetR/AcrR family transcriptional regulator [Propionibacteriales bacterium]